MAASRKPLIPLKLHRRHPNVTPVQEECLSPSQIVPGIYLSSCELAKDVGKLKELNITRVINVTQDIPNYHEDKGIKYLRIPIQDSCETQISDYFDLTHEFIEEALKNNENILVHCYAGISRSPTIVMSYLMKKNKLSFKEIHDLVKTKRKKINPNLSFVGQLLLFEKTLV